LSSLGLDDHVLDIGNEHDLGSWGADGRFGGDLFPSLLDLGLRFVLCHDKGGQGKEGDDCEGDGLLAHDIAP